MASRSGETEVDLLAPPAWTVNNKHIHRLWREEGLRVPYRKHKRPLRGIGVAVGAMYPIAPNVIWALDFQFDQTSDGRILKLLNVIDEYSRECLAVVVERSIDADGVVRCLERLAAERGAPRYVRFDHGPEFIAFAGRGLVPPKGHRHGLHRPRIALAERLDRVVQRAPARRVSERPTLRVPVRSAGPSRGLEDRLQHEPTSQRAWLAHPGRVRRGSAQPTTASARIASWSTNGIPSLCLNMCG